MSATAHRAACNICGGDSFTEGPNGRVCPNGLTPRCANCRSLERHRQLRRVYARLPGEFLSTLQVLQLSPDIGVDPNWFRGYEVSVFGGENSLDLQAMDRPDASYDLVICNHVLEHVADDRAGFRELVRVAGPHGLVQVTVPSPQTRAVTEDWGYPRPEDHGHYRKYGRELTDYFRPTVPGICLLEVRSVDLSTGAAGHVYLWTLDESLHDRLREWIPASMRVES